MNTGKIIAIALVCIALSGLVSYLVSSNRESPQRIGNESLHSDMKEIMNLLDKVDGRLQALEKTSMTLPEKPSVQLAKRMQKTEKQIDQIQETIKKFASDGSAAKQHKGTGHMEMPEAPKDNSKIAEKVIDEIVKNPERIMKSMKKRALKKSHNPMDILAPLDLDEEQVKLAQAIMNDAIEKYVDLTSRRDKMTPEEYKEEMRKLSERRKGAFGEILDYEQYKKYEEMEKRMSESRHEPSSQKP